VLSPVATLVKHPKITRDVEIGIPGEIVRLRGWNWYARSDPTQIGSGQYDFETTVTHELGHALGLGHSAAPVSPMNETLATGMANRNVTAAHLNIPIRLRELTRSARLVTHPVPPSSAAAAQAPPCMSQNVWLIAWDLALADLPSARPFQPRRKRT
jgi:hypothetical protein